MTMQTEGTGELTFISLKDYQGSAWFKPAEFFWLDRLGVLPIADSEFMALAHFCPIAIEMHETGPRPVAVLHSQLIGHRLISDEGRWRPPYAPLALRSMPFRVGTALTPDAVDICPEIAETGADAKLRQAMFGHKGGPTQPYATILSMLHRLQKSAVRLRNATKVLLAMDILRPLTNVPPGPFGPLYTIGLDSMLALQPSRIMALTADACCPLELATTIAFSRRWLVPDAVKGDGRPFSSSRSGVRQKLYDHHIVDPLDEPFGLDESPLFNFDEPGETSKGPS
jgi:hypothetical protein